MDIDKSRKARIKHEFGTLRGLYRGTFFSYNLGFLLETNEFLKRYELSSADTINSFFSGRPLSAKPYVAPAVLKDSIRENHTRAMERGNPYITTQTNYMPITTNYIKGLIELDEMMRLSKRWNSRDRVLYRGTVPLDKINMRQLNSWSISKICANSFVADEEGALLMTHLPAHFPFVLLTSLDNCVYKGEQEVLLPPCGFKVEKSEPPVNGTTLATVTLKPLSLAKEFLRAMENPPSDFPEYFITDPIFEFEEAKQLLKTYVETYVDTKRIKFGRKIFKEAPDPSFVLVQEEEGYQK